VTISTRELAAELGLQMEGCDVALDRVAPLENADAASLSYFSDHRYRSALARTAAGAVILRSEDVVAAPGTALISDNPALDFARAAARLHPRQHPAPGVHPTAVVDARAQIDPTASIGAFCVIEADVSVAANVQVGPHAVVGAGTRIGRDTQVGARVVICAGCIIGERVLLHPGAIIGRDGFGFARDGERWVRIPQVGRVRLGNDVEIGANTVVDRGAMDDTVIGDGVKLDNLIQIGHNVVVGDNTAMAACSGISGSTRIGRRCTIAGAVGMAGHLTIGDDVHFTGMAMVTRSQTKPGIYSSGIPAMPNAQWRRTVGRFRRLDSLMERIERLEKALGAAGDE
jgi:UDP-3-O-[3-hydroxymyristoyl] glucosamine N-acyltransferase